MNNQRRFELLSAYLDQELTPQEIEQVEKWLSNDPEAQKIYKNLLQLRYHLREMPVPPSHRSSEALACSVVGNVHQQTVKQVLFWSGGTIAALFVTIISGVFSWTGSPISRLAESNESNLPSDSLMIAIDEPVVEIPIVPVSTTSEKSEKTIPSSRQNH